MTAAGRWGCIRSGLESTPNPYRFGGAWGYITDPSGLLQLGARFYWPEMGRFMQREPRHGPPVHQTMQPAGPLSFARIGGPVVGPARGVGHPCAYAGSRALTHIDPSGYDYWDIGGSVPLIGAPELGLGLMAGVMLGANPCAPGPRAWWDVYGYLRKYVHPYGGIGAGTPGLGINYAPGFQVPGHRWSFQTTAYVVSPVGPPVDGAGGRGLSAEGQGFLEIGTGTPGAWAGVYYGF